MVIRNLFQKQQNDIRWNTKLYEMFRLATLHFGYVARCELTVVLPRCIFAHKKKSFALHATSCAHAEEKKNPKTYC
jgi:hypothetical protein